MAKIKQNSFVLTIAAILVVGFGLMALFLLPINKSDSSFVYSEREIEKITEQSESDDIDAIEKDLDDTEIENLDSELRDIENELR